MKSLSDDEKSVSSEQAPTEPQEPLAPPERETEVTRIYQYPDGYVALDERDKLIEALLKEFPNVPQFEDDQYQPGSHEEAIVTSAWVDIKRFLHNMNMSNKALGPYHCVLTVGLFKDAQAVSDWALRYILESKWELSIMPFLLSPADYYLKKFERGEDVDDWTFVFPFVKE